MTIRKTTMADLPAVMDIYAEARDMMRQNRNPDQWAGAYPPREMIEADISAGASYVCEPGEANSPIAAVFYFRVEQDPTYEKIDGAWLDDKPYGVIHRIARRHDAKGAGAFCICWCYAQYSNIKIDTHCDNIPMRKLLEHLGFTYCGIIWLANGDERLAFQKN